MPEFPFRWRTRIHPRARHVRIRVTPREGLVVTVPPGAPHARIIAALEHHRDWILARFEEQAPLRAALTRIPERLDLPAIGTGWAIEWHESDSPCLSAEGGRLRIGAMGPETTHHLLARFVRDQAHRHLPPWLDRLARRYGFRPAGCTIRSQKTRWGSCSTTGRISLNDRLLFLPPALVEHVLLHELTHLEHPNHGPDFHRRLRQIDPQAERHARILRHEAHRLVPPWLPEGTA